MLPYLGSQRSSQSEVFQKARAFIDQGDVKRAYDYVSQQTLTTTSQGQTVYSADTRGTLDIENLKAGLSIAYERGADDKWEIVDTCKYCGK